MADRQSAGMFADIFNFLAGFNSDQTRSEPTKRDRSFAHELWKSLGQYDFSYYQMYCDEALEVLGLARRDLSSGRERWDYGPKEPEPSQIKKDLSTAETGLVIPASNLWSDFRWPDWVPQKLRTQIEEFWCPEMKRGPKDWFESNSIPLGAFMTLRMLIGNEMVEGRFVHRWNNLAAIVQPSGVWYVVSAG